ncbi:MAG: P1 family peptidase [Candidatus Schekmanbacteria bacterium]|nr:P1 family peptidase [Candidatus Schekmanbacteria bacterium]
MENDTLTAIAGIKVGHYTDTDGITGCTAILCPGGAVAGVDIRGTAAGTRQVDALSPLHLVPVIHGVCLSGGSAYGLEAGGGVMRYLEDHGVGLRVGVALVPIVPTAVLFDLGVGKPGVRPAMSAGYSAAAAATAAPVVQGSVGAGTGATVGKVLGIAHATKGGVGSAAVARGELVVAALAAVNAYGDVVRESGLQARIIAGTRATPAGSEMAGSERLLSLGGVQAGPSSQLALPGPTPPVTPEQAFQHTTLVVLATNALLTKAEATKIAQLGQVGVARSLSPAHTLYDGDVVFALSTGTLAAPLNQVGVLAIEAVLAAVARGVERAVGLGGVPAMAELR